MPRIGVAVFVWKDDKFIMIQRWGSHGEGKWSIPGGHLEFGETWEDCAAREVMEETGVTIADPALFAVTNDIFESEDKHYITLWIKSKWAAGEPQNLEPEKCKAIEWRTIHDLPAPLFEPCWQNLKATMPDLFEHPSDQI